AMRGSFSPARSTVSACSRARRGASQTPHANRAQNARVILIPLGPTATLTPPSSLGAVSSSTAPVPTRSALAANAHEDATSLPYAELDAPRPAALQTLFTHDSFARFASFEASTRSVTPVTAAAAPAPIASQPSVRCALPRDSLGVLGALGAV